MSCLEGCCFLAVRKREEEKKRKKERIKEEKKRSSYSRLTCFPFRDRGHELHSFPFDLRLFISSFSYFLFVLM